MDCQGTTLDGQRRDRGPESGFAMVLGARNGRRAAGNKAADKAGSQLIDGCGSRFVMIASTGWSGPGG